MQDRRLDRPDLQLDGARVAELFRERDVAPAEFRHAHVDGDGHALEGRRPAALLRGRASSDAHAPACVRIAALSRPLSLHQQPADAAGGVAAGLDLAAVGVVDAHEGVGAGFGRLDGDELVEADAGRAVGKPRGSPPASGARSAPRVNDQKIVAEAVHLEERDHGHRLERPVCRGYMADTERQFQRGRPGVPGKGEDGWRKDGSLR